MSPQKEIVIASVGLDDTTAMHMHTYINLHTQLNGAHWAYRDNLDAATASMELLNSEAFDIVLLDVDSPSGKRSQYTLKAMNPEINLILITSDAAAFEGQSVLEKPLSGKNIISAIEEIVNRKIQ